MRHTILILLFVAGTPAFSQSVSLASQTTAMQTQNPINFNWPGTDFSKIPPAFHGSMIATPARTIVLSAPPLGLKDPVPSDSQMIIHPPKKSLGIQSQGKLVAQNEYPGLQFLPIESSSKELRPIPIIWPALKLQAIPTKWPLLKLLPLDPAATVAKSASAK
jgi:hypothetical protein